MRLLKKVAKLFFVFPVIAFAQTAEISGKITDAKVNPIEDANVYLRGTVLGSSTDAKGNFVIKNIPSGEFKLVISVIGYKVEEIDVTLTAGQKYEAGMIMLETSALQSEPVVVTASKYEQNLQDVPVSMSTLSAKDIEYRNSITVDDALKYVSGINMNQDQINIRGSSGYSRGVGSRVMMLVDGVPYLTGDTGEINFESLQTNQIERIEVLKGAGSALYGSNAIGGVINVISKDISETPQLGVRMYGGIYSEPYYPEWKWSDKTRYLSGVGINYSAKVEKVGLRLGISHDKDDSYKRNDWRKRYHLGGKFEYDLTPFQKLSISSNYMYQHRGNFLYWESLRNALEPTDNQLNDEVKSQRFYINSTFQKIIDKDNYYSVKAIWFHNKFEDNIADSVNMKGNNSTSEFADIEFQYNKKINSHFFTAGVSAALNRVTSSIFGNRSSENAAVFLQDEIKWNSDWSTSLGIRTDYYNIESVHSDYQINPKLGIVFKPWEGGAFRASTGQGFRAPSLAEAFTSTTTDLFIVIPNEKLKPEKSWSVELGMNQFFAKNIFADVSVFYNRYWDLIEGTLLETNSKGKLKIQFRNITNARIAGTEINFNWNIFPQYLDTRFSYTFIDPQDLEINDYLNYRPRHLLYAGSQFSYDNFKFGADYRFISKYDRIDKLFSRIIVNSEERVSVHVLDLRLSADFLVKRIPVEVSLQINNFLQYNYVDLVGSIAPIRHFVLTLAATF